MMPTQIDSEHIVIPQRIDSAWNSILPGLQAMQEREPCDWDIDYIRDMLDDGEAMLVVDPHDATAFAVVELKPYKYEPDELELFVHLVYHRGGNAIERFHERMESLAREGCAKYMRFHSARPGMLKLVQPHGYHWQSAEFVKEL